MWKAGDLSLRNSQLKTNAGSLVRTDKENDDLFATGQRFLSFTQYARRGGWGRVNYRDFTTKEIAVEIKRSTRMWCDNKVISESPPLKE